MQSTQSQSKSKRWIAWIATAGVGGIAALFFLTRNATSDARSAPIKLVDGVPPVNFALEKLSVAR